ncbi:ABC transporter ATP-binding protein [Blastococcus sp. SYSU D01042]
MGAISVVGLTKRYGDREVLGGVDLEVARGSVCALLGPNGAGKTTTVRILATLARPDGGRVEVAGIDVLRHPRAVRRRIGLIGQQPAVDDALDARQNLVLFGRLHHLGRRAAAARADELLEQVDLTGTGAQPVREFSGGMRRRLDIAAGLVLDPEVLFLDEPTTGLDPAGRRDVWDAVRGLVAGGSAVLLTTQYLEEAEQLADQVCVLDGGRVVASGSPRELTAAVGGDRLELVVTDSSRAAEAALLAERVAAGPPVLRAGGIGERVVVAVSRRPGVVGDVARALDEAGIGVDDVVLRPATLDEAYLRLTGAERARTGVPA